MRVEALEKVWVDKARYDNAEKLYYEKLSDVAKPNSCSLVTEIAKAREHLQNTLEKIDGIKVEPCANTEVLSRLAALEATTKEYQGIFQTILSRVSQLENQLSSNKVNSTAPVSNADANAKVSAKADDDDDDVDLFGSDSDEEDEEHARIREERLTKYAEKKATKTAIIAKSSILLDVKPWDDEIDLKVMEAEIRKITLDGLLWGASKFVPVAFGIQKVVISCVVEDEKVSIDWLTEEIEKIEELVQSVDIAAFNKI
ncbi:probable elongation factor 1-delta isoform X1 [Drosophila sulfurigaster albostrigata]|uniref:probable elongation factor 1-delta isoform X1 n=1 Tax=Drosophila sulfurigaster albostrigata TaxID=89887 RepID=UPI002D21BFC5|nr:probable elongation factor 1-delta isoform X1 [Drosophila sulfurigaster albostrigata]